MAAAGRVSFDIVEQKEKARKKIDEAGKTLDEAQKRNDIIQKKLKGVEVIDGSEADELLGFQLELEE